MSVHLASSNYVPPGIKQTPEKQFQEHFSAFWATTKYIKTYTIAVCFVCSLLCRLIFLQIAV